MTALWGNMNTTKNTMQNDCTATHIYQSNQAAMKEMAFPGFFQCNNKRLGAQNCSHPANFELSMQAGLDMEYRKCVLLERDYCQAIFTVDELNELLPIPPTPQTLLKASSPKSDGSSDVLFLDTTNTSLFSTLEDESDATQELSSLSKQDTHQQSTGINNSNSPNAFTTKHKKICPSRSEYRKNLRKPVKPTTERTIQTYSEWKRLRAAQSHTNLIRSAPTYVRYCHDRTPCCGIVPWNKECITLPERPPTPPTPTYPWDESEEKFGTGLNIVQGPARLNPSLKGNQLLSADERITVIIALTPDIDNCMKSKKPPNISVSKVLQVARQNEDFLQVLGDVLYRKKCTIAEATASFRSVLRSEFRPRRHCSRN